MAGKLKHLTARRAVAALIAAGTLGFGVTTITTATHASAGFEIPNKTCTAPTETDGVPEPGDTIVCTVMAAGVIATGESVVVAPTAPTGATVTGCTSFLTGSGYTSVATPVGSSACTYLITAVPTPVAGNSELGTETVLIPASTPDNTSVTQSGEICEAAPVGCSSAFPMGVSGPGSCVDGTAFPGLGGCEPVAPGGTPTPPPPTCIPIPSDGFLCIPPTAPPPTCIAIPSDGFLCFPPSGSPSICIPIPSDGTLCFPPNTSPPSCLPIPGLPPPLGCPTEGGTPTPSSPGSSQNGGGGGNGSGGSGGSGSSSGAVQAAATTTPFTSGPEHPAPILGITIITIGGVLALTAAFGPELRRRFRIRVERSRNDW